MAMKFSLFLFFVSLVLYVLSTTVLGDYVGENGILVERGFHIFGASLVFFCLGVTVLAAKGFALLYRRLQHK